MTNQEPKYDCCDSPETKLIGKRYKCTNCNYLHFWWEPEPEEVDWVKHFIEVAEDFSHKSADLNENPELARLGFGNGDDFLASFIEAIRRLKNERDVAREEADRLMEESEPIGELEDGELKFFADIKKERDDLQEKLDQIKKWLWSNPPLPSSAVELYDIVFDFKDKE